MTNKKKILIAIAIVLALVLSFIGGQTLSKYISQVNGSGIADVAKWSFKVNGESTQMKNINLASTYNAETLVDGKIAPGVTGNFDIIIDTTDCEVGTSYVVNFNNEQNKPANFKFIYDNKEYNSIKDIETKLVGTINANEENKIKSHTIYWKWDYETGSTQQNINTNDIQDTKDGKTIENYTFDINVIGTQVEPNA